MAAVGACARRALLPTDPALQLGAPVSRDAIRRDVSPAGRALNWQTALALFAEAGLQMDSTVSLLIVAGDVEVGG